MKRLLSIFIFLGMITTFPCLFPAYTQAEQNYVFLEDGKYVARKAYLGIEVEKSENIGVEIKDVPDTGRAYKAGIRPGDVLIEFNGEQVKSVIEVNGVLDSIKNGQKIGMTLLRRGSKYATEVTKNTTLKGMGLIIESASLSKTGTGVIVTNVQKGSPAEIIGIQEGDIIVGLDLKPTLHPNDIENILNECEIGSIVSLEYFRDEEKHTVEVELGKIELTVANFDTLNDLYVKAGDTAPLLTIEVEGDLNIDRSITWIFQNGSNGFWLEKDVKREVKGLRIENSFNEEEGLYRSTLWANSITNKNNGQYCVRIRDNHGLIIESKFFTINVY